MVTYEMIKDKLNKLNITVEVVEHEPAVTIELADKFIEGIEGVRTKTLLFTNKKTPEAYLLVMDDGKRIDMKKFKAIVGSKHISMASEEALFEKMKLTPGVVSPFGLLNNEDGNIKVYIDKEIMSEERMSFHPNTNEKTLFIPSEDIVKFIGSIGYEVEIIEL